MHPASNLMSYGTYTVSVSEDGRSATFTASPTPLAVFVFLTFVLFPPYAFLLFLAINVVFGNRFFAEKLEPSLTRLMGMCVTGGRAIVDKVMEMLDEDGRANEDGRSDTEARVNQDDVDSDEATNGSDKSERTEDLTTSTRTDATEQLYE